MIQPSRILNEKNGFLGLTYSDCALLVILTLQLHGYFSLYEKEWVALGVGPLLALGLIQIRMKYRSGIITSFFYFFLRKRRIRVPRFVEEETFLFQFKQWIFYLILKIKGKEGEDHASEIRSSLLSGS
jgi:hypothetical protein